MPQVLSGEYFSDTGILSRETLQESKGVPMVWELIDPQLRYTPKVRGTTLSLGNGSKASRLGSLT